MTRAMLFTKPSSLIDGEDRYTVVTLPGPTAYAWQVHSERYTALPPPGRQPYSHPQFQILREAANSRTNDPESQEAS